MKNVAQETIRNLKCRSEYSFDSLLLLPRYIQNNMGILKYHTLLVAKNHSPRDSDTAEAKFWSHAPFSLLIQTNGESSVVDKRDALAKTILPHKLRS